MSADMKLVAGGCRDNVVRIWDASTGHTLEALKGHTDQVTGVIFTADGKGLISGSADRTVRRWDLTALVNRGTRLRLSSRTDCHPVIDTAQIDGYCERGWVCMHNFTGHKNYVQCVTISPDGQWIVSGSEDRDVRIWNGSTAEPLVLLRGHTYTGESSHVQIRSCIVLKVTEISLFC